MALWEAIFGGVMGAWGMFEDRSTLVGVWLFLRIPNHSWVAESAVLQYPNENLSQNALNIHQAKYLEFQFLS
jgi:hypothetical protein